MSEIKAVPVVYKGITTRSTLEGRIMVLLDELGANWHYETETYDVDGNWYMPDFEVKDVAVPGGVLYIEAKGEIRGGDAELKKIGKFAKEKPLYIMNTMPCGNNIQQIWADADKGRIMMKSAPPAFDLFLVEVCFGHRALRGGLLVVNKQGRVCVVASDALDADHIDVERTVAAYQTAKNYAFDKYRAEMQKPTMEIDTEKAERKSKRCQILMRPSLHRKLQATAKTKGISVNDLTNQIIEQGLEMVRL